MSGRYHKVFLDTWSMLRIVAIGLQHGAAMSGGGLDRKTMAAATPSASA
jgi:hypothetical protein